MSDWAKGRRQVMESLLEGSSPDAGYEPNRRLTQIAALLNMSVSQLSAGASPHSDDRLDQCVLMMTLFARIEDPVARTRLIAAARNALS